MQKQDETLYDRGFRQGTCIECIDLESDTCLVIEDHRAASRKRSKPIIASAKDAKPNMIIVMSQDCDISQGNDVELAFAKPLPPKKIRQANQKTRSLDKLHMPALGETWEIEASMISIVPQDDLLKDQQFKPTNTGLNSSEINLLITWRTRSYTRDPLPDGFNKSFLSNYLRKGPNKFDSLLEKYANEIVDIYVHIYPNDESAEVYFVSFTALLSDDVADDCVETIKTEAKEMIEEVNGQNGLHALQIDIPKDFSSENLPSTMLSVAMPYDFTMEDATRMKTLRLDSYCWAD